MFEDIVVDARVLTFRKMESPQPATNMTLGQILEELFRNVCAFLQAQGHNIRVALKNLSQLIVRDTCSFQIERSETAQCANLVMLLAKEIPHR